MADNSSKPSTPNKYRAFWHLEAIRVLQTSSSDGSGYTAPVWESLDEAPPALVALIDTGVSDHPYLKGKIKKYVDLTGMPARRAGDSPNHKSPFEGIGEELLKSLDLDKDLDADDFAWLVRLAVENSTLLPFDSQAPSTSNRLFSSHGTACAGLVVASPNYTTRRTEGPDPLVYCGVDPFSELLSITTTFAPKPETLLFAFLYAVLEKADVILLPRGMRTDVEKPRGHAVNGTADEAELRRLRKWRVLRAVVLAVSRRVPIVCAAGNDAESRLIPPAALATESAGENGIIAVGAMSYLGIRSSYSSYGHGLTVVGPSDDGEMFNEDQARLDETDRFFPDFPYAATYLTAGVGKVEFAEQAILAIDVPGAFGFSDSGNSLSSKRESITPFSGFFTEFGGTSAAASIVAGVAALVQRAAKHRRGAPLSGPAVRKILQQSARNEGQGLPHDDGGKVPRTDRINGHDLSFEQAFGAGLVDAVAAVDLVVPAAPLP